MKVPAGWTTAPLGDVSDVLDYARVPINAEAREKRPGPIPYFGATGQVGWIDDWIFDEELILLGEDGAPFLDANKPKAYRVTGKSWVNNHAHVLRGCRGISNRFLLHQLNATDYAPFVSGTTRLKLPQGQMRLISLRIAPEREQERVVVALEEHLSRIEAGVLALERVKKEVARYRASVLKTACEGRLVPTEAALARAEGRPYEPASELLARIRVDRRERWNHDKKYAEPRPLDASVLPPLPKGWQWASVEELSWDSSYGTSLKCDYREHGLPILRIPNISGSRLDLADLKRLLQPGEGIGQEDLVAPGDMLVVRTNGSRELIGRAAVVNVPPATSCYFASYLIRFRLCASSPTWKFVSLYWQTPQQRRAIESRAATSAGQYNVNQSSLGALAVPIPPLAEQQRIVAEVDRRLSIADGIAATVDSALARAARLRQSILKRAFEGKLVPQDPSDEPASVLLARIRAEREAANAQSKPSKRTRRPSGSAETPPGVGRRRKETPP